MKIHIFENGKYGKDYIYAVFYKHNNKLLIKYVSKYNEYELQEIRLKLDNIQIIKLKNFLNKLNILNE